MRNSYHQLICVFFSVCCRLLPVNGTGRLLAFSVKKLLLPIALLFSVITSYAQNIPSSAGTALCAICTPNSDWQVVTGTPDVSDRNTAATNGTSGGGTAWNGAPLPLPPNNHNYWITIRDIGDPGAEEAIKTTMTGLVAGREYEVTVYSMSAIGGYAGKYIDQFDFQVGALSRVNVNDVSQNVWGTNKLRFTANASSMDLTFYPGFDAGSGVANFECVNISVTLDAINQIPIAENKTATTKKTTPVTIDAVENAVDLDGTIVPSTVDLDPSTPGIQQTATTADGEWTVNSSGIVTFTAVEGFRGEATIPYTLQDNYSLDGVSAPGISSPKTITVFVQYAELTVTKTITSAGPYDGTDDVITYDITIENTGNVTIDNIVLTDANAAIPAGEENIGTLAPGTDVTITVTHAITQDDLDNGSVSNQGTATGEDPVGDPVTDDSDDPGTPDPNDPTATDIVQTPELTVTKTITSTGPYDGTDDVITYDIVVTNTGNVTIDNIVLTDANAVIPAGEENIGTLAPTESVTITVTHAVTQADLDLGSVGNQATVNGDGPGGDPLTPVDSDDPGTPDPEDPTATEVVQTPELTVTKVITSAGPYDGTDDVITYDIVVTNTGNVTIDNIVLTDANAAIPAGEENIGTLAPGADVTITVTHAVTQADLDLGSVGNQATVTGEDPTGDPLTPVDSDDPGTPDPEDPTGTEVAQTPELTVTKVITSTDPYDGTDDVITYDITVTNTGNVTIDNIVLTDANAVIPAGEENIGTLAPGADVTITVTHAITQADLDAGSVSNQATATGEDPTGDPVTDDSDDPGTPDPEDPTATDVVQTPELTVTKVITSAGPYDGTDDVITYDIVITNSGNVTIDNIVLTDANAVIPAGEENIGTLAPGADVTITVTHAVTQDDLDLGSVSNQATVNGDGPGGDPLTPVDSDDPGTPDPNDPTGTDVVQTPELTVTKTITSTGPYDGTDDVITYDITVTNTGNVTIDNIVLTDANAAIPVGEENIGTLAPGADVTITVTHAVTQDDLNNGSVSNQATATGEDWTGDPLTPVNSDDPGTPDPEDPTATDIVQTPELTVTKTITSTGPYDGTDDVITYDIVVTNTGNVTIDNIVLTDANAAIPAGQENIGTLAPGADMTITVTHAITQADLDAGSVSNQATATGEDPVGDPVTDDSDDPGTGDPDDPTGTDVVQTPELTVTKTITSTGPYDGTDDVITYDIVVTNTGNVTIDNIVLTDANAAIPAGEENIGTLAPGADVTIAVTHAVTQDDLDAGSVSNQATVNGDGPGGDPLTPVDSDDPGTPDPEDPTNTDVVQTPELTVTKVITSTGPYDGTDDVITYDITVANTGNVTIDNIVLTDANAVIPVGEENIGTLAPGADVTITVTHAVTQDDLNNGSVSNQATATGEDPTGDPLTPVNSDDPGTPDPEDPTATDIVQTPELTVTKTVTSAGPYDSTDDVITYDIVVENTGNVTIDNIVLTDANAAIPAGEENIGTLAPGADVTITVTHAITQADLDAGSVSNQATAMGEDPVGDPVTDDSDDPGTPDPEDPTGTEVAQTPELTVTKVITSTGPYDGTDDVITYDIVVTNTGNVTIDNIVLTDANAVIPAGEENIGTLAPGADVTITVTHAITQDDLNNGNVSNQATVTGEDPDGKPVSDDSDNPDTPDDPDDATDIVIAQQPELTVTKVITSAGPYNAVGDVITYNVTIANTGNVTIDNIVLTDANAVIPAGQEYIGTLASTENTTIEVTHTVTQADLDAGSVSNQATAAGEDPTGDPVTDDSDDPGTPDPEDPTVTNVVQTPELTVTKVVISAGPYDSTDDVITYDITVANTGNVTIDNIVLTDANAVIPAGQEHIGTLAPGANTTITVTHAITQDDLDNGSVSNRATATGEDPTGNQVTDDSDNPDTPDDPDDATDIAVEQQSALIITKTARQGEHALIGDVITYDITVTNSGNVSLKNIVLTDANADAGSIAPATIAALAPGESRNAVAIHTITQADIDAGYVYNIAQATGEAPNGDEVSDESHDPDPLDPDAPVVGDCTTCTATPIEIKPAVALVAVATNSGSGRNGAFLVGDEIEYRFTVTNTGNTTLRGFVLNDAKLGLKDVVVNETLAPGGSFVRTFRYTITAADILAKQVVTTATVDAQSPAGETTSDVSGNDVTNDVPTRVPVAEGPESLDDEGTTPQNTPVTVNVVDNDEEGSSELDLATVRLIDPETGEPSEEVTIAGEGAYKVGSDGTITFTPIREFYGESTIQYVVRDVNGLEADPATLTVTVARSQPAASDDTQQGTFNGPIEIQLVSNDQPDTAPLDPSTIEIVSQPQHGTLQVNGDGTVTYTPNQYYTGPDEFTYRVMDANGNWTNVATVRITVSGSHIPNIITPNGDGQNDRFVIVGLADYDNADVVIFNRWGNEVYRSRNYKQDWDAQGINEGTYYYLITLRKDGQETVHKGWLVIKRN